MLNRPRVNILDRIRNNVVDFVTQHPYLSLAALAGTTYLLAGYFTQESDAELCNGVRVGGDYFNPAGEVCNRLASKVGFFTSKVTVGIYDNARYKLATHGAKLDIIDEQYHQGYFISRLFCDIPAKVLTVCKPDVNNFRIR